MNVALGNPERTVGSPRQVYIPTTINGEIIADIRGVTTIIRPPKAITGSIKLDNKRILYAHKNVDKALSRHVIYTGSPACQIDVTRPVCSRGVAFVIACAPIVGPPGYIRINYQRQRPVIVANRKRYYPGMQFKG